MVTLLDPEDDFSSSLPSVGHGTNVHPLLTEQGSQSAVVSLGGNPSLPTYIDEHHLPNGIRARREYGTLFFSTVTREHSPQKWMFAHALKHGHTFLIQRCKVNPNNPDRVYREYASYPDADTFHAIFEKEYALHHKSIFNLMPGTVRVSANQQIKLNFDVDEVYDKEPSEAMKIGIVTRLRYVLNRVFCRIDPTLSEKDISYIIMSNNRWKPNGKYKCSYHIVFPGIYVDDNKRGMTKVLFLIVDEIYNDPTNDCLKIVKYDKNGKGQPTILVDLGVATNNRVMRVLGAYKAGDDPNKQPFVVHSSHGIASEDVDLETYITRPVSEKYFQSHFTEQMLMTEVAKIDLWDINMTTAQHLINAHHGDQRWAKVARFQSISPSTPKNGSPFSGSPFSATTPTSAQRRRFSFSGFDEPPRRKMSSGHGSSPTTVNHYKATIAPQPITIEKGQEEKCIERYFRQLGDTSTRVQYTGQKNYYNGSIIGSGARYCPISGGSHSSNKCYFTVTPRWVNYFCHSVHCKGQKYRIPVQGTQSSSGEPDFEVKPRKRTLILPQFRK